MPSRRIISVALASGGLLACLLLVRSCIAPLAGIRKLYAERPPAEAFQRVFSQPIPAGVTELAATGEDWLGGSYIWVTFRAPRSVAQALVKGWTEGVSTREERREADYVRERLRYDPEDRIGWKGLFADRDMAVYSRAGGDGTTVTAYLDPSTGRVFVFLYGI